MGMYDNLVCKYPLDSPEHNECMFQTKDLDNMLEFYLITQDGLLKKFKSKTKTVDTGEDIDTRHEESYEQYSNLNEDLYLHVNFTGEIRFYDFEDEEIGKDGFSETNGWIEYSAYFINGKLQSVTRIK